MKYTQDHEWVAEEVDGVRQIGITDYAIENLGDIVHVELPAVGQQVAKGDVVANIESVKAASDIYAPISGEIVAVNEDLEATPALLNEQGGTVWIFAIHENDASEFDNLLSDAEYRNQLDD